MRVRTDELSRRTRAAVCGGIAVIGVAVGLSAGTTAGKAAVARPQDAPAAGTLAVVAGTGTSGTPSSGTSTDVDLNAPWGVAVDGGDVYIADSGAGDVEQVSGGELTIPASSLNGPDAVASYDGTIYIVNGGDGTIDKLTNGSLSTWVTGLNYPDGIAIDSAGDVYVAEIGANEVVKFTPSGSESVVAGTGSAGAPTTGVAATSSDLDYPQGVAVNSAGDVFIADSNNNVIEEVSGGVLSIVAGNGSQGAPTPGVAATDSPLGAPTAVAVDSAGDIFISDAINHVIEEVGTNGIISVVAGTVGASGTTTDGPATDTDLNSPHQLAVDSDGNLYIADVGNPSVSHGDVDVDEVYGVASSSSGGTTTTTTTTTPSTTTTTPTTTTSSEGGTRAAAVSVSCTADFATREDTCGASVADASGDSSLITPTGSVSFTSGDGGGSFVGGNCSLQQTEFSPGIASCTTGFQPTNVNVVPDIEAHYAGDAVFAASSGGVQLGPESSENPSATGQANTNGDATQYQQNVPAGSTTVDTTNTSQSGGTALEILEAEGYEDSQIDGVLADLAQPGEAQDAQVAVFRDELGMSEADIQTVLSYAAAQASSPQSTQPDSTLQQGEDDANSDPTSLGFAGPDENAWTGVDSTDGASGGDDSGELRTARLKTDAINPRAITSATTAHASSSAYLAPSIKAVILAIAAPHPTAADVKAFDQALTYATAPVFSPQRAFARVSLVTAVAIGIHTVAHTAGDKTVKAFLTHLDRIKLGEVTVKLRAHRKIKSVIKATTLGARILRILDVVGLRGTTDIHLSVTVTRADRHRTTTRPIHVI